GKKEIVIGIDDILSESILEGDWPKAVNRLVIKTDKNVEKLNYLDFWSRIVKIDEEFGSGGTYITGWIISFFPYDSAEESLKPDYLKLEYIPDGIVRVPFEANIGHKLKFVAGFIGANQEILEDSDGESVVSPVIGWIIDDTSSDESNFEFYFLSFFIVFQEL
ncbi:31531_t:CDS:2, partial [Gigaspora margarita]